jgi:DNA-binding transcriptional LysR family regulator
MRYKHLDLNLLVALDALLNEQNVSRAAEKIHLTQPAMSNALSRLRAYFDDELLIKTGQRMALTPKAEYLMKPVRELLIRIDSEIMTPHEFDPRSSSRSFSMLVSDYTTTVYVPALLSFLHPVAPALRIDLQPQTGDPHELLEKGDIDFLIIPAQYVSSRHPSARLFDENYVVIAWSENRRIRSALTLDDYLSAGHVATNVGSVGSGQRTTLEAWFLGNAGLTRRIEVTAPTMASLPRLVVGTDRLATVHRRVAVLAQAHLPIRIFEPPVDLPTLTEMLQWNKLRETDAGLRWFRDLCQRVAQEI